MSCNTKSEVSDLKSYVSTASSITSKKWVRGHRQISVLMLSKFTRFKQLLFPSPRKSDGSNSDDFRGNKGWFAQIRIMCDAKFGDDPQGKVSFRKLETGFSCELKTYINTKRLLSVN